MTRLVVRFAGQRAYRLDRSGRWVRIPFDIAKMSVAEGRAVEVAK